ncbi:hypothetical protein LRS10_11605 [Phenylobacterium sp. J426]|uniref:hypothetical protein n=1 Tax=Phenylobacterium sp. J426 TaxID=2898439 RepID=UPI002151A268|nr:hypothetical protein [Phenylobacterium sp. J426]MCR5874754.1 hypothetical protein [Phenylobacterium sp. J426]
MAMLELSSRWVLHLEIAMLSNPAEAPTLWLRDEMGVLFEALETGQAVQLINNETAAIRLRDIRFDAEHDALILLFNYSDKNISDPVFENLETGDLRTEPKLEGEGVAVSAHMVVDLRPVQAGVSAYRAVLEDAPGIGRSKIEPFLTYLYRIASRIQFAAPDGRVKRCRPLFEMSGRQSETLRNDLQNGRLSMIELVQHLPAGDGFDEDGGVRVEARTLKLSVEQHAGEQAIDLLNRVRGRARELGYPNMKVRWTQGRQKSAEFGTAREDAGDVLVFRTTEIRSDVPLPQCESRIRDASATRLIEVLRADEE